MSRFPRLPKSALRPPKGFKKPDVKDFQADMKRLGQEIAQDFCDTIVENIETNKYGFSLKENTTLRKQKDIPLVDTHQLVDAIYREETTVSVQNTSREDSSLTNLELAIVQEYGTKDLHVPARPVWRKTWKDFRPVAKEQIKNFLESQGKFKTDGHNSSKRIHTKE